MGRKLPEKRRLEAVCSVKCLEKVLCSLCLSCGDTGGVSTVHGTSQSTPVFGRHFIKHFPEHLLGVWGFGTSVAGGPTSNFGGHSLPLTTQRTLPY